MIRQTDGINSFGMVRVLKRDKRTGIITFDKWFKNQLTNYALSQAALSWGQTVNGQAIVFPSEISVGTGSPPSGQSGTTPNDTGLWAELSGSRKNVDYAQQWLQYYIQYSVTYQQTEVLDPNNTANNEQITLTECGLWDKNGNLWSHVQLNGVTHDNTSTLAIQWQVLQKGN